MAPEEELLLGVLLPDAPLLGVELLLGLELELPADEPPEAEPELDLDGSFAGSLAPEDELEELGELGVAELPPEGELVLEELEPALDGGVEDDGELELLLPLPADLPLPLSWPQAARPKAMATATARVESFMCPPWLG